MSTARMPDDLMKEAIAALEAANGNQTHAAAALGISRTTLQSRLLAAKIHLKVAGSEHDPNGIVYLKSRVKRLEDELRALRKFEAEQGSQLHIIKSLIRDCDEPITPPKWLDVKSSGTNTGVPTLLASDWHFDEVVDPRQINGVNAFNRPIALRRIKRLFTKTVDLLIHHMAKPKYDYFVLDLGGDMLSGNIHEELRETNETPVSLSMLALMDALVAGIDLLLGHFPKMVVNCVPGNHGRWDKKPRAKNRVYETYEWILYQFLAKHYAGNKNVHFNVADGADLPYSIYNTRYLLTHGDQFRGGSGIAGAMCVSPETPILKSDLSYCPAGDLKVGDELIGFDETVPGGRRKFKSAVVIHYERQEADCLEVETEDGVRTIATLNHPWLTRSATAHAWSRTENLHIGSRILSLGKPWEKSNTWESGYLSGVLDGEGHIEVGRNNARIGFAQQYNACLKQSIEILERLKIPFSMSHNRSARANGYEDVMNVRLFGGEGKSTYYILQLLGQLEPKRLLDEKGKRVWLNRSVQICKEVRVSALRYVGKKEICSFSTSTATYIANGMLCHNSPLMLGDARKRKRSIAIDQPYDYMVLGHWHQYIMAKGIIVNGSLKGADEYSFQSNFDYELPTQALWVTHPIWGITARWPIYLEKPGVKY